MIYGWFLSRQDLSVGWFRTGSAAGRVAPAAACSRQRWPRRDRELVRRIAKATFEPSAAFDF
jgi:hypothetical protein